MSAAAPPTNSDTSGIPSYIRPRPNRVLGLPAPAWAGLLSVAALVVVELIARLGLVSRIDLIPPTEMIRRAVELLGDREFVLDQLVPTLGLIAISFAVASVLAIAVAYLMWRSPWWRRGLQPYLSVYYAIPIFAIYPIMVVLFGTGSVPIVVLSAAFAVVVIITNTMTGFDAVPETVQKLARSRRLNRRQYFTKVLMPAATPDIVTGLRLGLVYATIAVLASQFIISTSGLGHFISDAYESFATTDMYAGIVLICVLALVLNITVAAVLNRIDWRRR